MAIQIMFDSANEVQSPTMVLANRNGKSIGAIIPKNLHYSESMNSYNEMSFDVYKIIDGVTCPHWSKIKDFKLVYCVEWDAYFEIYVETDESDETIKHIQGRSLAEAELSQIKVYDLEINTELDISRDDYKPTIIYSSDEEQSLMHKLLEKTPSFEIGHVDISIAKLQRTFTFNDKTVYDALQEVSEEVKCLFEFVSNKGENGKIQRIINIYDLSPFCGECGHRNVDGDICPEYSSNPTGHSSYNGRDIKSGYGEDTNIFVSKQNLTDEITYSSDVDSVKNCFKLTAGDDLMTATVRNCSPSKSGYLWHFTEDVMSDMSDDLRDIISQYKNAYEQYNTQFEPGDIEYDVDHTGEWSKIRSEYNSVAERYKPDYIAPDQFVNYLDMMNLYYDTIDLELYLRSGMMPTVTLDKIKAADHIVDFDSNFNLYLQTAESLNNLNKYTAENLIESFLKTIVDSAFQIKLTLNAFDTSVKRWVGSLKIVSYLDDEDEASKNITVNFGVNEQEYTKQKLETSLAKTKSETPDVITLFNVGEGSYTKTKFKSEIAKYGLTPLIRLRDAGQACLNILIEMGIAGNKASSFWVQSLLNQNNNLYNELYVPYYNRVKWLNEEIKKREEEIEKVIGRFNSDGDLVSHGMMSYLEVLISSLQEKLDLEGYIYTNTDNKDTALELLKELVSFRREDTYKNDNFISDGLDNAQIFARALEFVQEAEKDIKSSAVPVHTISSTLKNFLVMPEFKSIVKNFKVGNWIRAEIDSVIYKLRLINYDIGFDDLDNIQVEFSDVQAIKDSAADIQSILNQASSLASNYSNIKILANNSKKSGDYVWEWVNDGLALTKMKIVDDANNQNIYWDENGFLCREYSPVLDAYEDKQLKIINKGLYLTDDNWRTTRAGIGNFIYYDPSDGEYKESYGVIADTLVGNLILSESVGIYNINNSVRIDSNGFIITTKNGSDVFKIRKDNGNDSYENLLYLDENGDLHIKGHIDATSLTLGDNSNIGGNYELTDEDKAYLESIKTSASNSATSASNYASSASQSATNASNSATSASGYASNAYTYSQDAKTYYQNSAAEYNKIIQLGETNGYVAFGVPKGTDSGDNYYFKVEKEGLLTARNAVIHGTVYATGGEFFGSLYGQLMATYDNQPRYNFVVNDNQVYAGWDNTNKRYNFHIDESGNVTIIGSVTVTGGSSGGGTGGGDYELSDADKAYLESIKTSASQSATNASNSANKASSSATSASGHASSASQSATNASNSATSASGYASNAYTYSQDAKTYYQNSAAEYNKIIQLGETNGYVAFGVPKGTDSGDNYYFKVEKEGLLTARNAVIHGTVYATGGEFFGSLYGQLMATYDNQPRYNFVVNDNQVYAGWDNVNKRYNFHIDESGNVTIIGSVTVTGGSSGGGTGGGDYELSDADKAYLESIKTSASNSATSASNYASSASQSATNASNSANKASSSATSASGHASSASQSASNASGYASSASGSASNAASSASNALTYANNAYSYATSAQSSYNDIIRLGETNGYVAYAVPKGVNSGTNSYFCVSKDGLLEARNAVIRGKIYATEGEFFGKIESEEGEIGGWSINNKSLSYGNTYIYSNDGTTDNNFIKVNSGAFCISHSGYITACAGLNSIGDIHAKSYVANGGSLTNSTKSYIFNTYIESGGYIKANSYIEAVTKIKAGTDIEATGTVKSTSIETSNYISAGSYIKANNRIECGNVVLGISDLTNGYDYNGLTKLINGSYRCIINMRSDTGAVNVGCRYSNNSNDTTSRAPRINIHSSGTVQIRGTELDLTNISMNTGSDRRLKYDINNFSDVHENVFSLLKPSNYKYIDGTSGRTHFGFIAQEVRDAIEQSGLTTKDAAVFVSRISDNGEEEYALCYSEFIALNTHMIQKCLKEINSLKEENKSLKQQLEEIKQAI